MMFEYWLETDLQRLAEVKHSGIVFSQDSGANKIGVKVTNNGIPVTLTGTVNGYVIKPDGTTIEITGDKSGNEAWVVLSSSAYSVVGSISVFVKLINGTEVTTLGGVEAYVYPSKTANVL